MRNLHQLIPTPKPPYFLIQPLLSILVRNPESIYHMSIMSCPMCLIHESVYLISVQSAVFHTSVV